MIRLIALDLDDTLLAPDLTIPEPSKEAIRRARELGVAVILATGRMFRSALPYARELDLHLPLIAYNGALVREVDSNDVVSHTPIPREIARSIARYCTLGGLDLNVYLNDDYFVARRTPAVEYYEAISGLTAQVAGDLDSLLREAPDDPTKLLIVAEPEEAGDLAARLAGMYPGTLNVMRSRPRFVEIVREGVDKWPGVLAIAQRLKVNPANIMAMGDGANDREMIRRAGLGICVPHAPAAVKVEADYVTHEDNGLGVAEAIERFVL